MITNGDLHRTMSNHGIATVMLLFVRMAEAGLFEGQSDKEILDSLEFYLDTDSSRGGKEAALEFQLRKILDI